MTSRAPSEKYVAELLEPWPEARHHFRVEPGTKHDRLLLDGRVILVLPRKVKSEGHRARNAAALIKRLLHC